MARVIEGLVTNPREKVVNVTANYTTVIDDAIVNVEAETATIVISPVYNVGKRLLVRKIHATQGTITIEFSGDEKVTRAALTSVTLNSDGDFWLIEKVSSTRWELVDGVERYHVLTAMFGTNQGFNTYKKHANGDIELRSLKGFVDEKIAGAATAFTSISSMFDDFSPTGFIPQEFFVTLCRFHANNDYTGNTSYALEVLRIEGAVYLWNTGRTPASTHFSYTVGTNDSLSRVVQATARGTWY